MHFASHERSQGGEERIGGESDENDKRGACDGVSEETAHAEYSEKALEKIGSKRKRTIMLISSLTIGILTIFFLINFNFHELLITISHVNPLFFAAAILVHFIALFIWSIRLKILSDFVGSRSRRRSQQMFGGLNELQEFNERNEKTQKTQKNELNCGEKKDEEKYEEKKDKTCNKLSVFDSLKIVFASLFGACITPSQFGGEPIRIYLLSKRFLSVGDSTVVVFGERVFDFFVVMIGAILSILFLYSIAEPSIKPFLMIINIFLIAIFCISSAIILIGIRNPARIKRDLERVLGVFERFVLRKFGKRDVMERFHEHAQRELENFCSAISVIRDEGGRVILMSFVLSASLWTVDFCVPPLILLSLNENPVWIPFFAAQFILLILVTIPLTPGSSGVAEISFTYLCGMIGIHISAVFTLLWRFIVYYMNMLVGAVSGMIFMREHHAEHRAENRA